jgi:hypothetical protein
VSALACIAAVSGRCFHVTACYCGYIFSGVQQRGLADTWLAD